MACQRGLVLPQALHILDNEFCESSYVALATCGIPKKSNEQSAQTSLIGIKSTFFPKKSFQRTRRGQKMAFVLNTSGIPGDGGQENISSDSPDVGGTRLGRIVSASGRQLLEKLNSARKNFPMKVFLLLLGFYTANALATVLGQTGDWDVLVAGVVVAAIEGIGMLMYKKPPSLSSGRMQSFVVMVNYWKAGVCLGLFVDAFKLGS